MNKKKVYTIAEIGNNHNGSVELAIEMVKSAKKSGADCVKFQMRQLKHIYRSKNFDVSDDLGVEYQINLLERFNLSNEDHFKIFNFCGDNKIDYMCTPWEIKSVEILNSFGVKNFKISSADLLNFNLIEEVIKIADNLILSTGMASEEEIDSTINFLNDFNINYSLLHCNSTYPAPFHDINLNWLKKLKKKCNNIGYSGHERGFIPTLGAVALGAKIVERHFTFDKDMEGPDHAASLLPEEFLEMVNSIRIMET